jgi:hypothetical protein
VEHVFCFVSFLQCLVWFTFSSVPRWPNTTTPVSPIARPHVGERATTVATSSALPTIKEM